MMVAGAPGALSVPLADMPAADPPSPAAVAALVAITSAEADPARGDAAIARSRRGDPRRGAMPASSVVWAHDPREAAGRLISAAASPRTMRPRSRRPIERDALDRGARDLAGDDRRRWPARWPRPGRPAASRCRWPRAVGRRRRRGRRRAPRPGDPVARHAREGRRPADRRADRHRAHARQPGAGDGPDPRHRRAHARADGARHPRRAHPAALGRDARGAAAGGGPRGRRGGRPAHPRVDPAGRRPHLRDRRRRAARDARADRPPAPGPVRGPPPGGHPPGRGDRLRGAHRRRDPSRVDRRVPGQRCIHHPADHPLPDPPGDAHQCSAPRARHAGRRARDRGRLRA